MSRRLTLAFGTLIGALALTYPVAKLMPAPAVCVEIDPARISWFAGDFVFRTPSGERVVAPRTELHFGLSGRTFHCNDGFWL